MARGLKPASLGAEIPEARLRKLRAYSQGLIAPLIKHTEEGLVRPEEVVIILLAGALFTQLRHVLDSEKVPAGPLVNELFEGKDAVELPDFYLETPDPSGDEISPRKVRKKR